MDECAMLMEHRKLINYIADKYGSKINPKLHVYEMEDFRSEAVIAAIKAIRTYKEGRDQKLTTYISKCIRNRIADIERAVNSQRRNADLVYDEDVLQSFADKEHAVLDREETYLVSQILSGARRSEINKSHSKKYNIEVKKSKELIDLCLCRIHHKLKSTVQNQY